MTNKIPSVTTALAVIFLPLALVGQEEERSEIFKEAEKVERVKPEVKDTDAKISVGTKAYDAGSMEELFQELKEENRRLAEEEAPHLAQDSLEVIELQAINVTPYELPGYNELAAKIDPRPRQQLARLAALDPAAAADIIVTKRAEERFFAGENDMTYDSNAGRTANVDFRKVGATLDEALNKLDESMKKKKVTDDQADVPDKER